MRPSLLLFLLLPALSWGRIVINEVAFDEPTGSPDWIELYNTGPDDAPLQGWTLDDEDAADGNEILLSVSTPLPAGAFLVVFVDAGGADDADFSDGAGAVFSGTATTVSLAASEDELALRSPDGVVDFMAWVTDGSYGGSADQADAWAEGVWTAGAVLSLSDTGSGYSIARVTDGADRDAPDDFGARPQPTPGRSNLLPVIPAVPRPPPGGPVLSVDPAANPFSPVDTDPARRAARFLFDAGSVEAAMTLRIYDVRGQPVRSFRDLEGDMVLWDGTDDGGRLLPTGIYVVYFESVDPAGARRRGKGTVVLGPSR